MDFIFSNKSNNEVVPRFKSPFDARNVKIESDTDLDVTPPQSPPIKKARIVNAHYKENVAANLLPITDFELNSWNKPCANVGASVNEHGWVEKHQSNWKFPTYMTISELNELTKTQEATIHFCQNHGLIAASMKCPTCDEAMNMKY
jgi:hypothetical protein